MATLTIRNLSLRVVASLKSLAERNHRSMEQEVREMVERQVGDRLSAIEQIKASWKSQKRATTTGEIDSWIRQGRR
jgi:plasmid stability protein